MTASTPIRAALVVLLVSAACTRAGGPKAAPRPSAGAPAAAPEVVATVDGLPIKSDELDKRVEKRLARLRQEEYEIRKEALEEIIAERLLEKEAGVRGISKEQLLKDEVELQAGQPDEKLVESLYEQNKARFGGKPKEEVLPEIRAVIKDRTRAEKRASLERRLRGKATVEVALVPPRTDVPVPASAPALGPTGAPVTIVEFADYQCPYCHRAQSTIDKVMSSYAGKVQLVHRDFPLEGHPGAFPAARAARCAGEQGKFWDYHRNLMTAEGPFDSADFKARAAKLKLDSGAFATCLSSDRHDASIRESLEAGTRAGVTGTPAYFINGRLLSGARPFEAFQEVIESEMQRGRS
jgi:protein-disulfide isomerase